MDDAPPPTSHTLRPHHIDLLAIFILLFKEFETKLSPAFTLHVYRVLLNEVSEVSEPKSHKDVINELFIGPKADDVQSMLMINKLQGLPSESRTADFLTILFHNVASLFLDKSDEEPAILVRRSIFYYFTKRCFVSFVKLSFTGVVKLQKDYLAWCEGDNKAGYWASDKESLTNDMLMFKTHADMKSWAQPESFSAWEKGQVTGDETTATENLRRFFEQHFHESNDSGIRQHALLNLVRMHYLRNEFPAARKLLLEAITVARTSGDRLTLQHCIGMLHRMPNAEHDRRPILNDIQPNLNPLEILFDVKKLTTVAFGQPLSASFERIVQAIGLYDHWIDGQATASVESEQWGQHAVQAYVWRLVGCERVASVEERIVTAFTEVGGDDNNRFTVTLNRAYNRARQGKYDDGLSILLDTDTWRGISLDDYGLWAHRVWHILALRASRRGQIRLYREFLRPRRPRNPSTHLSKEYFFDGDGTTLPIITEELFQVIEMQQRFDQGPAAIEQLLTALWHSEFQCRLNLYRTGIILLADVSLHFGLSKRCRSLLQEIMPQVINGDDLEQRGMACFTFARCIIAAAQERETGLRESIQYLLIAEADYAALECAQSLMNVQFLLSVVFDNLGLEKERDDAAKRHKATDQERKRLEAMAVDDQVKVVWQLVAQVGTVLPQR